MPRVPQALRRYAVRIRPLLSAYAPHLLVLTGGLVVYLVATGLFPYHSANHDEGVYLQQAAMLLDGQLTLQPPVEDAFRPWFFIEDGDVLYPKYAPVPAAIFAIGVALGTPRIALALVGAAIVALTYAIGRELFDRRTGLLAGALLLTSPLFVLDTATFLPYAPTTALNLTFAYAYLRAERGPGRPHRTRWAAVAGLSIGLAFFARPYTAVLFATPFIVHALVTFARDRPLTTLTACRERRLVTAVLGLFGVTLALAYNWTLTGHPLVFPYQVFAPLDGLGFGHREILDHSIRYTPELALRVNARVLRVYATDWAPMGVVGTGLAALGAISVRRSGDWRHAVLAGVFATVALGNVYFWGNYNILGAIDIAGDGLVSLLGPYYHFDLLLPTAVFAAHAIRTATDRASGRLTGALEPSTARLVVVVVLASSLVIGGGATAAAFDDPVSRNAGVTMEYQQAYEPFTDDGAPPTDAVVFLPEPYGPWLNHPFQLLRNDPSYRDSTVYALQENQFAVIDVYPDRRHYRYAYRGTWNPFDGSSITPRLQRVSVEEAETVTVDAALDVPPTASSVSLRLATDEDHAYYAAPTAGSTRALQLHVNGSRAWVTGQDVQAVGTATVPVGHTTGLELVVNVNTPGGGFEYRIRVPVSTTASGDRRVLTPELEVCTTPQLCGGEATYIPGPEGADYEMNVTVHPAVVNSTPPAN